MSMAMRITHTPGPWAVRKEHEKQTGWRNLCIESDSGLIVANMVMQTQDNERANARLIAAAPEMLELLRAYVLADHDMGGDTSKAEAHNARLNAARALIARVEGQQ